MKTFEVLGYQEGNTYWMELTKHIDGRDPMVSQHKMEVDSITELEQVIVEYQSSLKHYGVRVVVAVEK